MLFTYITVCQPLTPSQLNYNKFNSQQTVRKELKSFHTMAKKQKTVSAPDDGAGVSSCPTSCLLLQDPDEDCVGLDGGP